MVMDIVNNLIIIYIYIIILYSVLSFFPETRQSRLYDFLNHICEPYLKLFRFATIGSISFAPILAIFGLEFIQYVIEQILFYI